VSAPAGPWRTAWGRLRADPGARWALRFLALVAAILLLAPLLPLPSPMALDLRGRPTAPVPPWVELGNDGWDRAAYWELAAPDRLLQGLRARAFGTWQTGPWLGTDAKGRDLLARVVWGGRVSLQVGLAAGLVSLGIGVAVGAVAGYAGGRVDRLLMRGVDVLYALPFLFLVIFALGVLGGRGGEQAVAGARRAPESLTVFYVVLGLVSWLTMARVVRGQVLALRRAPFVEAARTLGASPLRVLGVHVLPNVLSVVIVYLTLSMPAVILLESFLSFLGLGVRPPRVSWGSLAADGIAAINPLTSFWWLVVAPGAAMAATLLALNVLGDGERRP